MVCWLLSDFTFVSIEIVLHDVSGLTIFSRWWFYFSYALQFAAYLQKRWCKRVRAKCIRDKEKKKREKIRMIAYLIVQTPFLPNGTLQSCRVQLLPMVVNLFYVNSLFVGVFVCPSFDFLVIFAFFFLHFILYFFMFFPLCFAHCCFFISFQTYLKRFWTIWSIHVHLRYNNKT